MEKGQTPDAKASFSQESIRSYVLQNYLTIDHHEHGEVFYSHAQKAYITILFLKIEYSENEVKEMFTSVGMDNSADVEFAQFLLFAHGK